MANEKERLIKLLDECIEAEFPWDHNGDRADYLLANGVIVPPCKIGDKIYRLVTRQTKSYDYSTGSPIITENQHTFIQQTYLTKSNFFKVMEDFGKTVFLTFEEAKNAKDRGVEIREIAERWEKDD